ncbi:hypothetical protein QR680_016324 [Steinernema hermaphroditum]|uniref:Uncharacterized protein n=1 Tax=Steinernema hermaphroditum TaxID=289476 RepID=A0AA39LLT1_9BILA|nr:hypothetical protein QR680_016324 [Steinernema hermaphroditum]
MWNVSSRYNNYGCEDEEEVGLLQAILQIVQQLLQSISGVAGGIPIAGGVVGQLGNAASGAAGSIGNVAQGAAGAAGKAVPAF